MTNPSPKSAPRAPKITKAERPVVRIGVSAALVIALAIVIATCIIVGAMDKAKAAPLPPTPPAKVAVHKVHHPKAKVAQATPAAQPMQVVVHVVADCPASFQVASTKEEPIY